MMFKDNKYTRAYLAIIERAKGRVRDGYMESHHIVPESLDGPNTPENKVWLTAREHFIAHLLLVKAVEGKNAYFKMAHALWFFQGNHLHNNLTYTSKTYSMMRKFKSEASSVPQKPEHVAKRALANMGKKRSGDQLGNLSAGQQAYYEDVDLKVLSARAQKAAQTREARGSNKGGRPKGTRMNDAQKKHQSQQMKNDNRLCLRASCIACLKETTANALKKFHQKCVST